jgi:hemolysin activation/secretion protein
MTKFAFNLSCVLKGRWALLAALAGAPALTLAAPDAGSVLQQLEARPANGMVLPKLKTPQTPTPPAAGHEGGPVLHVNAFRIEGLTLVDEKTVQTALQGFTGRDLSLTQLQEAAWVVMQTCRQAGWMVNALVPQQEVEKGLVTLRVVEARLGQVRLLNDNPANARLPLAHIQAMLDAQLVPGQAININQLDQLSLLIDDMPGVSVSVSFAEGKSDASTDLLIALGADRLLDANVSFDNQGSVSTGEQRLSANASFNNPGGLGDQLQLQAVDTEGSRYARLAYSLPVGTKSWRAGVHASDMHYQLTGSFVNLQASGSALSVGLDLNVPLVRQPEHNLALQLTTDHKQLRNLSLPSAVVSEAAVVSRYQLDVLRLGASGNWLDTLWDAAQNSSSAQISWGRINLNDSPNANADALAANTAGSFYKLTANYNREQSLMVGVSWYLQANAQWAHRNLDSSEKIYLGGANGVRAYPSNEVGGSAGASASTGLKLRLNDATLLNAFVDWGRVQVYRNNHTASGSELMAVNMQSLKGWGLSTQWRSAQGQELSLTYSRRLGVNPAANASTGADSDGTRVLNRLWLSVALNF